LHRIDDSDVAVVYGADAYYISRLPIVKRRLAQGGVRLAAILNSIFDPNAPQHISPKGLPTSLVDVP